jgi:hypothetical protein
MCPDILTIMPETNLVVWSFYDQITGFGVYDMKKKKTPYLAP